MKVINYAIWLVQVACLATILYCSWLLLEHPTFAIVAAGIVLGATLYIETMFPQGPE